MALLLKYSCEHGNRCTLPENCYECAKVEIKRLRAQNKELVEALESLCGKSDMVGWIGEVIDSLSDYDDEYVIKQVKELGKAKLEGEQALAKIKGGVI